MLSHNTAVKSTHSLLTTLVFPLCKILGQPVCQQERYHALLAGSSSTRGVGAIETAATTCGRESAAASTNSPNTSGSRDTGSSGTGTVRSSSGSSSVGGGGPVFANRTLLRLVTDASCARSACEEIVKAGCGAVAVDCEGIHLGRFGRLCLLQVFAPPNHLLLCDALQPGVVQAFEPLLCSKHIRKICHDCREDNSALYHQFGLSMRNVFDTQVAHALVLTAQRLPVFQVGMSDLLTEYLLLKPDGLSSSIKQQMSQDMSLWFRRPLSKDLVRYAVQGVLHLPALMTSLLDKMNTLGCETQECVKQTTKFTRYRFLNANFESATQIATRGSFIQGMLAARTDHSLIFKLNCGRQAIACTPSAMARFSDVQLGEIADLRVSTVSVDGMFVYVDREDGLNDYWNLKRRCRVRHETTRSSCLVDSGRNTEKIGGGWQGGYNNDPQLTPQLDCEDHDGSE
eukprot:GHVS01020437.1.p1 GENE.GHVS01020437.1~~GHVS01020437.1.p1  ORF type:complete len:456 (-),score=69.12 GHVS01020437.1:909-2276(-)